MSRIRINNDNGFIRDENNSLQENHDNNLTIIADPDIKPSDMVLAFVSGLFILGIIWFVSVTLN